jgi:hypothetical protein
MTEAARLSETLVPNYHTAQFYKLGSHEIYRSNKPNKLNAVALVRKRTILTEQPPHIGEASANFCG